MVAAGEFRADLYYRVAVAVVRVPPLRERPEDVDALVAQIISRAPEARRFAPSGETLEILRRHDWPGNVRELRNLVERALAWGDERVLRFAAPIEPDAGGIRIEGQFEGMSFRDAKQAVVDAFERQFVASLLERCDHNVSAAARMAQMDRNYLTKLIARHGLDRRKPETED
jgi:DNA-binding NtrC family response regulator